MGYRAPTRLSTAAAAILLALAVVRAVVSFAEAFATVSAARAEDRELLQICESGTGGSSARFRAACLETKADLASPILFKALLLAVSTAYRDFVDLASTPFSCMTLVLFAMLSLASPTRGIIDALTGGGRDETPTHNHVVLLAGDDSSVPRSIRGVRYLRAGARAVSGALRLRRNAPVDQNSILELGGDDGDSDDTFHTIHLHEKYE